MAPAPTLTLRPRVMGPSTFAHIGVIVAVHGGGVGSGDHIAHPGLVGTGGNGLQAAGGLVIDLVAVDVDELIVLLGQLKADVEGLNGILTGELEVRDGTGSVGAHLQGVLQQLFALGIAQNAVLGEGDDLDIHEVLDFLTQLQQRLHSGQLGVVDVNVGTDVLDTVGGLHPDGLVYTVLYLLLGEEGLILLPALDALKQGAAHVPVGTACGQAGIQVDVRLDDGGQGQLAAGAKQCRNPWLPELRTMPGGVDELIALAEELGCEHRHVLVESGHKSVMSLTPDTLGQPGRTLCVVGPEGGFTAQEVEKLTRAGFLPATLGERVLRWETAAVCSAAGSRNTLVPSAPNSASCASMAASAS